VLPEPPPLNVAIVIGVVPAVADTGILAEMIGIGMIHEGGNEKVVF